MSYPQGLQLARHDSSPSDTILLSTSLNGNISSRKTRQSKQVLILIADIDREMEMKKIESILVFGDSTVGNPDLRYVVGASLARGGIYVQRKSHDSTLIVSNIDVGSARLGRVRNIRTYSDYGYERIASKYDRDEARIRFYQKIIKDEGLH